MNRGHTVVLLAMLASLGIGSGETAQAQPIGTRARLRPGVARIGERVIYRGEIVVPTGTRVRWLDPEQREELTWGPRREGRKSSRWAPRRYGRDARRPSTVAQSIDTAWVEVPLQAFQVGEHPLPGLRFEIPGPSGPPQVQSGRLPMVHLIVAPTLTAADSQATLRPVRGPLAAPWWERVPWRWVAAAVALLVMLVWLWRHWRRPRVSAPSLPAAARDPAAEALEALARLREQKHPEAGRFAEHAFALGQILRRFLEATIGTTRPGDTSPELLLHLRDAGLDPEDLKRLSGLLRVWDRVKFAREPMTLGEAGRAEIAVEALIRRKPAPLEQVA